MAHAAEAIIRVVMVFLRVGVAAQRVPGRCNHQHYVGESRIFATRGATTRRVKWLFYSAGDPTERDVLVIAEMSLRRCGATVKDS